MTYGMRRTIKWAHGEPKMSERKEGDVPGEVRGRPRIVKPIGERGEDRSDFWVFVSPDPRVPDGIESAYALGPTSATEALKLASEIYAQLKVGGGAAPYIGPYVAAPRERTIILGEQELGKQIFTLRRSASGEFDVRFRDSVNVMRQFSTHESDRGNAERAAKQIITGVLTADDLTRNGLRSDEEFSR